MRGLDDAEVSSRVDAYEMRRGRVRLDPTGMRCGSRLFLRILNMDLTSTRAPVQSEMSCAGGSSFLASVAPRIDLILVE